MTTLPAPVPVERIVNTMLDLVLVTDKRGTILHVNPVASAILGYQPSEMEGRTAQDFLFPDDLDATREEMRQARRGKATRHFECRYIHRSGLIVTLLWTGVWDEEAQQHIFVGRDVTQIRAMESMRTIEAKLDHIDKRLRVRASRVAYVGMLLRRSDVSVFEGMLALGSAWACLVLLRPPSNFAAFPGTFSLIQELPFSEWDFGLFAALAAAIKIAGIGMGATRKWRHWSTSVRCIGLAMSGAFWTAMGISALLGNPDSLFSFPGGIVVGALAFWSCLRLVW